MAQQVRFGLTLSNRGVLMGVTTPREMLELAEMADSSGLFDNVWVGDSLMCRARMESITLMAAVAARTNHVRIGPACMASFPSRNPIVMAYQWASLDLLSKGRMILPACMGAGNDDPRQRTEYINMGVKASNRHRRMEEGIEILRLLWTENRVDYDGEFYQLKGAFIEPKPIQQPPPIWLASNPQIKTGVPEIIERNLRRVARIADGWMCNPTPVDEVAEMKLRIRGYAADYGRSFDDRPCAMYFNLNINEDVDEAFQESKKYMDAYYYMDASRDFIHTAISNGSPEECINRIHGIINAGVTDVLIRFPSWDQKGQFKRCVEEVLPHFK